MPIYEFQCEKCKTISDMFFRMVEKPSETICDCPVCQEQTKFVSVISAVPVNYNGINLGCKVSGDLKNRLDQIKKHYPDMQSTI